MKYSGVITVMSRAIIVGFVPAGGKFYQKQAVLQPAEVKQNQFSLPFKSTLYIAACKGGFHTTKQVGMEGGTSVNSQRV